MKKITFKIGDKVLTVKGGRLKDEGSFSGIITGFSKWRQYDAANVKKIGRNGREITVQCLVHNLVKI
jgi:hypothetical protein